LLRFYNFFEQIDVSSEGRILLSINPSAPDKSGLKFLLLNPAASHFGHLVSQCRAVIVAGGTMQPVEEFKEQLFVAAGGHLGKTANPRMLPPLLRRIDFGY
jgi:Rad3-related DNA helicase